MAKKRTADKQRRSQTKPRRKNDRNSRPEGSRGVPAAAPLEAADPFPESLDHEAPGPNVPIVVGVGASAGGLEAFSQLLEALPSSANITIIFVQHLSPQHESALPTLLASRTTMPIV